ncbi:hypothetical protein K438DRAFT_2097854 [Mycena galopus ATCC 62051]|nr:hypothetical protein K438DRAFT_2097854 [Mycena galopus ATCC 62051]
MTKDEPHIPYFGAARNRHAIEQFFAFFGSDIKTRDDDWADLGSFPSHVWSETCRQSNRMTGKNQRYGTTLIVRGRERALYGVKCASRLPVAESMFKNTSISVLSASDAMFESLIKVVPRASRIPARKFLQLVPVCDSTRVAIPGPSGNADREEQVQKKLRRRRLLGGQQMTGTTSAVHTRRSGGDEIRPCRIALRTICNVASATAGIPDQISIDAVMAIFLSPPATMHSRLGEFADEDCARQHRFISFAALKRAITAHRQGSNWKANHRLNSAQKYEDIGGVM